MLRIFSARRVLLGAAFMLLALTGTAAASVTAKPVWYFAQASGTGINAYWHPMLSTSDGDVSTFVMTAVPQSCATGPLTENDAYSIALPVGVSLKRKTATEATITPDETLSQGHPETGTASVTLASSTNDIGQPIITGKVVLSNANDARTSGCQGRWNIVALAQPNANTPIPIPGNDTYSTRNVRKPTKRAAISFTDRKHTVRDLIVGSTFMCGKTGDSAAVLVRSAAVLVRSLGRKAIHSDSHGRFSFTMYAPDMYNNIVKQVVTGSVGKRYASGTVTTTEPPGGFSDPDGNKNVKQTCAGSSRWEAALPRP